MLYDPKWEKPLPDIYSLESFSAWLAKQPPRKKYDYSGITNCAVAQYLRAHDIEFDYVTNAQIKSYGWFDIVNAGYGYTFGDAAKRAERKLHGPASRRLWRRFIKLFQ